MTAISPAELQRRLDAGEEIAVLDVRDRDEIDEWAIEGPGVDRRHLPYAKVLSAKVAGDPAKLVAAQEEATPDDGDAPDEYVVVCARGEASDEVAGVLRGAGVDAVNLEGGMEGWARLYRAAAVERDGADSGEAGPTLLQYRRPSSGCLAYVLVDGGEALVVDPLRAFDDRYAADAAERGAEVVAVLDTHVHADHVSGLRAVADATGATPAMSADAVDRGVAFDVETVADGDEIRVGDATVEVVATPGHTSGSVSLFAGGALLTGDALFTHAVPRPDLESGDDGAERMARELHRTLTERLVRFDDDVLVAPGHYSGRAERRGDGTYTAPLGEIRERLPAFSQSADEFVADVLDGMPPRPANFAEILGVNLGRETADPDDAFELELGPNNCAATAD